MNAPGKALGETHTHFGPAPQAEPLLSVLMITYNHEPFIREALESVFMQQVDFPIEVVIGEDCSTDRTREVIAECCKSAPFPVTLITSECNVGMHANFRRTLAACRGEFIALLEGDDYWIDPEKLVTARRTLAHHPTTVLWGHTTQIFSSQKASFDGCIPDHEVPISSRDFMEAGCPLHTSSLVFRNLRQLPGCTLLSLESSLCVDYGLKLFLAAHGNVMHHPKIMSVYRVNQGGISYDFNTEIQRWLRMKIRTLHAFNHDTQGRFADFVRKQIMIERHHQLINLVPRRLRPYARRVLLRFLPTQH